VLDKPSRCYRCRSALTWCSSQLLETVRRGSSRGAARVKLRLTPDDDRGCAGDRQQPNVDENDGDEELDESKSRARPCAENKHGAKLCLAP
jgi:hypothetical protein